MLLALVLGVGITGCGVPFVADDADTGTISDGDCFAVAVTHSDSLSVAYSQSHPIPDPESYAYAVADSDDAGPDIAASVAASYAGV